MTGSGPSAIFKYRVPFMEEVKMQLPQGAQVIRIDGLDGALWLWAVVDKGAPLEERVFHLFKTGAAMPSSTTYRYLGCGAIFIQMELMMYVFEEVYGGVR